MVMPACTGVARSESDMSKPVTTAYTSAAPGMAGNIISKPARHLPAMKISNPFMK